MGNSFQETSQSVLNGPQSHSGPSAGDNLADSPGVILRIDAVRELRSEASLLDQSSIEDISFERVHLKGCSDEGLFSISAPDLSDNSRAKKP
jgi:hypothetical protein